MYRAAVMILLLLNSSVMSSGLDDGTVVGLLSISAMAVTRFLGLSLLHKMIGEWVPNLKSLICPRTQLEIFPIAGRNLKF